LWTFDEVGHNQIGRQEVNELLGSSQFDTPKPTTLIRRILQISTNPETEEIVMDFFAGSATTGHAVLNLNQEDHGDRRFILVQVPEKTEASSFSTIADIGKERIRRAIERMQASNEDEEEETPQLSLDLDDGDNSVGTKLQDLGFKVFKLAPSTFRRWESPAETEALENQLSYFDEGLKDDADLQHVIYEVLLKEGYSLNSQIEPLELPSNTVYRITDEVVERAEETDQEEPQGPPPSFYLCLDEVIATETLDALPLDDQTTFVCLDNALDDSQKVNLALQCVLKTV
jgi:adenine-specific DNA-methyltransferase